MADETEVGVMDADISDEIKKKLAAFGASANRRSIPDARDGMKPVHRRILYVLNNIAKHKTIKSARIVGDVMGKHHPHGDASIYDAAARLSRDFQLQVPMVHGQGNLGSLNGGAQASMRYTEMQLGDGAYWLAMEGIENGAVRMVPNYDETEVEPSLLPVKAPMLLLNGAAVGSMGFGYAAAIPTHNPAELAAAAAVLVRAYAGLHSDGVVREAEDVFRDIMEAMPGPDFPTGGLVGGPDDIAEAYLTGVGTLTVRCEALIDNERGRILVLALPYGENSADVTTDVVEAQRGRVGKDKKRAPPQIPEIKAVRDEGTVDDDDKPVIRIVIDLKQGEDPGTVLEKLYRHTKLQKTFSVNMTALNGEGKPQLYNVVELLEQWLTFRMDCIKMQSSGRLREAALRRHVLEGMLLALEQIDGVVSTIRGTADDAGTVRGLMELLGATTKQADSISVMQLKRLNGERAAEFRAELERLQAEEAALLGVISDPARIYEQILGELEEFARRFPAHRRTRIAVLDSKDARALVAPEEGLLTITGRGYLRRVPASEFRAQHRGGKGKQGAKIKAEDALRAVVRCNSHDRIFPISDTGRVARLEAHEVPTGGGGRFAAALGFEDGELIAAVLAAPWPLPDGDEVVIASESGMVKRVALADLSGRNNVAMNLYGPADGRPVVGAALFPGGRGHVFLASSAGLGTRFEASDVRLTKRGSGGVIGIELPEGGSLVSMSRLRAEDDEGEFIMCVASDGYGKRVPKDQFPTQNRAGKGRILIKMHPGATLVAALVLGREDTVLVATRRGMTGRFRASDIRELGRSAVGSRVMALAEGDAVVAAAVLPPDDE
jgi:DNA gyrase subunit A